MCVEGLSERILVVVTRMDLCEGRGFPFGSESTVDTEML